MFFKEPAHSIIDLKSCYTSSVILTTDNALILLEGENERVLSSGKTIKCFSVARNSVMWICSEGIIHIAHTHLSQDKTQYTIANKKYKQIVTDDHKFVALDEDETLHFCHTGLPKFKINKATKSTIPKKYGNIQKIGMLPNLTHPHTSGDLIAPEFLSYPEFTVFCLTNSNELILIKEEQHTLKIKQVFHNVRDIKIGRSHILWLTTDGTVYGYGSNTMKQITNSEEKSYDTPVKIDVSNVTDFLPCNMKNYFLTSHNRLLVTGFEINIESTLPFHVKKMFPDIGKLDNACLLVDKNGSIYYIDPSEIKIYPKNLRVSFPDDACKQKIYKNKTFSDVTIRLSGSL